MRKREVARGISAFFKIRFLKKRIPLGVRLQLTNRCTSRCFYCNIWKTQSRELSTSEVFSILDQLSRLGTLVISFSGGDVLMRKDIGEIIDYCKSRHIRPEINSNGCLIPAKIDLIKNLSLVKLSLDGPEEVHDTVRGRKGSFREVMKAAELLKEKGIKFSFACTLTKHNIKNTDFLLKTAEKFDTFVGFQPLKVLYRGVADMKDIFPDKKDYRDAVKFLINAKRAGNKHIRNSLPELNHILKWPDYDYIKCWAGKIFCIIETNGDVYPCDRPEYDTQLPNCLELGVKEALGKLPEPDCKGCGFCGTLELNLLMSLDIRVLGTLKKLIG